MFVKLICDLFHRALGLYNIIHDWFVAFWSRLCKTIASLVVWGNSLSVISGKKKTIRADSSRKGDPKTTMGSPDQMSPRLEMNGIISPKMRDTVDVTPVA